MTRRRDGTFVVRLDDDQAGLLRALAAQLDPLLDDPSADPTLRRLFPPAHEEDVLAEAAWQIEQGASLRDSRRRSLAALAHPPSEPMDEEAMVTWVQGINALRLVLAERIGVTSDEAEEDLVVALAALVDSDEQAEAEAARSVLATWQVYRLLGAMLEGAVDALDDALP